MKKILSLSTLLLLLSGCQVVNYFKEDHPEPSNYSAVHANEETEDISDARPQEAPQTNQENSKPSNDLFLDEQIIGESSYPNLALPEDAPEDLNQAINDYYTDKLSPKEQQASQTEISQDSLNKVLEYINSDDDLAELEVEVDLTQLTIDDQKLIVPRLIIPMDYSSAEKLAKNNDSRIINHALTELGNRLLLVAYQTPDDHLVPIHLVNAKHSLYYDEP
ncbi:hypothetical protein HZY91_09490 [Facklamia sp. DSM 111018]|uniref:Uncharacterized protein n=1 Tax=Facklamia lactis TaxID=2749967 RepID=A0ABS0LSF6_9LACT|nr:hypothetical protein [Facklamia lactis]MBG9987100.1 hypothetical protein [Facklamia lactis]